MSLEQLVVSLKTLGIDYSVLESGAEGALLVLPEYGRVLGLWPHWRGENSLWVNPAFFHRLQFGAKDDGWMNPGGHRIWLAPREEFFDESPDRPSDSRLVPPSIDPGRYERLADKTGYAMETRGDARAWRADARVEFKIARRIRPLSEKRLVDAWGVTYLRQAGYEEETTLEVFGDCPLSVGLLAVVQVGGGTLARLAPREPSRGRRRVVCTEQREAGRSVLLVMDFDGPEPSRTAMPSHAAAPAVECRPGRDGGDAEIACLSPAIGEPEGKRRLVWRTSLCSLSGRSEEIEALALRVAPVGA